MALLVIFAISAGVFGSRLSSGFLPEEDQGYLYGSLELPYAASMERTSQAARKVEEALLSTPGVAHVTTVVGFNLLSTVQTTFNAFFFITLKPWDERAAPDEHYAALKRSINARRHLHARRSRGQRRKLPRRKPEPLSRSGASAA